MKHISKIIMLICISTLISGCHVSSHPRSHILKIDFSTYQEDRTWATATEAIFKHYGLYYSYTDLLDYQYVYLDSGTPTVDDIDWILWDLGWLDSYVTGTLSRSDISYQLQKGNPILLQYGDYYDSHYLLIYGYDGHNHVYIHEPGYGTHRVHYDDLYYHHFHGRGHYWESSLIIDN